MEWMHSRVVEHCDHQAPTHGRVRFVRTDLAAAKAGSSCASGLACAAATAPSGTTRAAPPSCARGQVDQLTQWVAMIDGQAHGLPSYAEALVVQETIEGLLGKRAVIPS